MLAHKSQYCVWSTFFKNIIPKILFLASFFNFLMYALLSAIHCRTSSASLPVGISPGCLGSLLSVNSSINPSSFPIDPPVCSYDSTTVLNWSRNDALLSLSRCLHLSRVVLASTMARNFCLRPSNLKMMLFI